MGTRSLISFCADRYTHEGTAYGGEPLCTIYRQWDGYPNGRGRQLAKWLLSFKMINGIGYGDRGAENVANGMECLAAQWIAYEKRAEYMTVDDRETNRIPDGASQVGSVYMYTPTFQLSDNVDAQYLYRVERTEKARRFRVVVFDSDSLKPIFTGGPKTMLNWIDNLENSDA